MAEYATVADLDAHIADILNAAAQWGGAITAGIRSAEAISNARQESALEVLRAIARNPDSGLFADLQDLVTVAHNSRVPQHDGELGVPKIVPFTGATARDGRPADADEIDSYRNNPASYTGAVDGIVIPHDQPNANKVEGAILTHSLNAGGAGYAVGDTGTVATGDGLATYEVLTVAMGVVVTYTIIARGSGYNAGVGVATATGGIQPGAGAGFKVDILTTGSNGTGKQSPISCYFSIVAQYFKFTGLSAQIPMIVIDDTMRDTKIPLSASPAVVKAAIPKLVKPGDALHLIASDYAREGKLDLIELAGGAIQVKPVKAVSEIVAALNKT